MYVSQSPTVFWLGADQIVDQYSSDWQCPVIQKKSQAVVSQPLLESDGRCPFRHLL